MDTVKDLFRWCGKRVLGTGVVRRALRRIAKVCLAISGRGGRPVWLVACGGARWGDNADALWQYLRSTHPGIDAIAVIKRSAKPPSDHGWVVRGSLENALLVLTAEVLATTHTLYDVGPRGLVWAASGKKVWLKHGVTGIKRHRPEPGKWEDFDLVCATSDRERRLVAAARGVELEAVQVTGFARHDRLFQSKDRVARKGVLYSPTFRPDFDPDEDQRDFTRLFSWMGRFQNGGSQVGPSRPVRIWVHPTWRNMENLLKSAPGAEIVRSDDPQDAIVRSEVIVTDYSSVAFDAAISGIPVVFYQPDRMAYLEKRGLFSPFVSNSTLLVVEEPGDLVNLLTRLLEDQRFRLDRISLDRAWASRYISTFDGRSCERIADALIE